MSEIVQITEDQVISKGKGKVRFINSDGMQVSLAKNQVQIIPNPADAAPSSETPPTDPAAPAPVEAPETSGDSQNLVKETSEVATKKRKASAKTGAKGVHKLGDAEFNLAKYVKSKTPSGSVTYNNGDEVAKKLDGKTLAEVYDIVSSKLGIGDRTLKEKYKHLNPGQQRMNLGNRLRKALRPAKEKKAKAKKAG